MTYPQLAVSRYTNKAIPDSGLAPIRFTRGHPRFSLRYKVAGKIDSLAPSRDTFALSDDHDAFTAAYRAQLDALDHDVIAAEIQAIIDTVPGATGAVLLCYEDVRLEGELCHRSIFATWWAERTGQPVTELANPDPPKPKPKPRVPRTHGMLTLF